MKENRGIITFGGDRRWLVDRNAADSARSGCSSWHDLQKRTNGSKQDAPYRDQDSRLRMMSHSAMVRLRIQRGKSLMSTTLAADARRRASVTGRAGLMTVEPKVLKGDGNRGKLLAESPAQPARPRRFR
jgi:hypothetical protein